MIGDSLQKSGFLLDVAIAKICESVSNTALITPSLAAILKASSIPYTECFHSEH
jgi:hypothetical protein